MGVALSTIPTARADAAEDKWSSMVGSWFADGLWPGQLNKGQVYADSTGLQVKVRSLKGIIGGFHGESSSESVLGVATANGANPRYDLVVLRLVRTVPATISLEIITGTPSVTPTVPVLTRNSVTYDIPMASVLVGAGVSSIVASAVTDLRVWAAPRHALQAGVNMDYVGTIAPDGYLLMAGQSVAVADYPALALLFGATGTNFTVPDMRGMFSRGAPSTSSPLGTGGADTVTLNTSHLPAHSHGVNDGGHAHGVNDPSHTHNIPRSLATASVAGTTNFVPSNTNGGLVASDGSYTGILIQGATTGITIQSAGNSSPFSILPSYRHMNRIIKAH